jgi:hypothetical protein
MGVIWSPLNPALLLLRLCMLKASRAGAGLRALTAAIRSKPCKTVTQGSKTWSRSNSKSDTSGYEFKPLLPGLGISSRDLSTDSKETTEAPAAAEKPQGFLSRLLSREASVASPEFTNRWAMVVPAFVTHMCIGSPWAWSVLSGTLSREIGVAGAAAADWSMAEATLPLSIVFAMQGISAAVGGTWAMRVGPRAAMTAASACFGGGLIIGGIGIDMHSLPLMYAGYGLLGGTGVGLAYTPPVQALISWFPDKKGLASGLTIAGFGSGALVFTPLINNLMAKFAKVCSTDMIK